MTALGDSRDCDAEPVHHHVASPKEGILSHFLPDPASRGIPIGAAAVLAPSWLPLYKLAGHLRKEGIPVIGPGARPYKRLHAFAAIAENVAAHLAERTAQSFASLQRSLFLTVRDLTGNPDWTVYSYRGRVLLCDLLGRVRPGASLPSDTGSWLTAAADAIAGLLLASEMLSPQQAEALRTSARGMLADIAANGIDPAQVSVADLGLFAIPGRSLQLLTMHKAKGREFDAVAIIDLHDGRVPDFRATTADELAEARRLLYVAVTRPRKVLMYFTDQSHPKNRPSPFLGSGGVDVL
jgi:DNA helicase-2/ATP-dependent DNA helicase PcrA